MMRDKRKDKYLEEIETFLINRHSIHKNQDYLS